LNRDKKMAAKVAKREPKGEMMLETKEGGIWLCHLICMCLYK
jgi:hypothetical protein